MQQSGAGPDLAGGLYATIERMVRLLREVSGPDGLSPTTTALLARLDLHGPARLTELARASRVTQPAMSQLVARLEQEGLVSRAEAPEDRRAVLIGLTEHGRRALESRREQNRTALAEILRDVPASDRQAIAAALPALDRLAATAAATTAARERSARR